jgi:demethylmenaquinone methyltransferase/2-methoxy-6-polyprenyl-1,4-benzoquinol methylase
MSKNIQKMFSQVPVTYERVNHVLTFGLDILWRKRAARKAARAGGTRWLDVCSGTGEMAAYLSRFAANGTALYATDFSLPMLEEACRKPEGRRIHFLLSDIKDLPFPENTFDLITISFATRNINLSRKILIRTFAGFHRALKPGGRFINLETSQPRSRAVRRLYHFYIALAVKRIGRFISGSNQAYAYLSETIPRFYPAEELADCLREAGFGRVRYETMLLGAAAIHEAVK